MPRRKAVYLDGGHEKPGKAALRALEGHPNRAAILEVIERSPDTYDLGLDSTSTLSLDGDGGYWESDGSQYSGVRHDPAFEVTLWDENEAAKPRPVKHLVKNGVRVL